MTEGEKNVSAIIESASFNDPTREKTQKYIYKNINGIGRDRVNTLCVHVHYANGKKIEWAKWRRWERVYLQSPPSFKCATCICICTTWFFWTKYFSYNHTINHHVRQNIRPERFSMLFEMGFFFTKFLLWFCYFAQRVNRTPTALHSTTTINNFNTLVPCPGPLTRTPTVR